MKALLASWARFGLRGRLFLAFGVVAGLTVLASASAIISYDRIGSALFVVTERSMPDIARTSKVVKAAAEVTAAAPNLLAAMDQAARDEAIKAVAAAREGLTVSIAALSASDAEKLGATGNRILENLGRLADAVKDRQTIAATRIKQVGGLRGAHQKLAEKLSPLADDAGFSLTLGLSGAAEKEQELDVIRKTLTGLADQELAVLQAVLELRAEANLMLGILVEASDLPSLDLLPPVRDRFSATAGRIDKAVKVLKDPDIAKLFDAFIAFGKTDSNVFDLRRKELESAVAAAKLVAENGALAKDFAAKLADLEQRSETSAAAAVNTSEAAISQGRVILISIAIASLGIAFLIGWLYVGRGVVRRLTGLQAGMKSIAAGNIDTEVATHGSDEIAEMAEAVRFFKQNMIESNRLRRERAEAERRMVDERKAEMTKLADEFESTVGGIVQTMSSSAGELETYATTLTKTAEMTERLSGVVESVSEDASLKVRSAAAATEEMSNSISEISRQVEESNRIAGEAVAAGADHRRAHRRVVEGGGPHRRRGQPDRDDRRADQSAGLECDDRGGAGRRVGARFCRGGAGGEGACLADREGDQRHQRADFRHAARHRRIGRGHQRDQRHDRQDLGHRGDHRRRGQSAGRCGGRNRPEHPADRARRERGCDQHRRGQFRRARNRQGFGAGARLGADARRRKRPSQAGDVAVRGDGPGDVRVRYCTSACVWPPTYTRHGVENDAGAWHGMPFPRWGRCRRRLWRSG